jgi:hypothetical protein
VLWQLPPNTLKSFYEIYILTYRFRGQLLKYYLDAYGFSYKYKYVQETPDGYELSDHKSVHPRQKYGDLIHIAGGTDLNESGNYVYAYSKSWYERDKNIYVARKSLRAWLDVAAPEQTPRVMWTTFKQCVPVMMKKVPKRGFLSCNAKATNKYANRDVLAYMINRYLNISVKTVLSRHNICVDEDEFALSEMLQWIFRSAVRNGEEIWIYVPSRRMRSLLLSWIEEVDGSAA